LRSFFLKTFFLPFVPVAPVPGAAVAFAILFIPLHCYWKSCLAIPSAMSFSCELLAPSF
jgi:hypothetical protein